MITQTELADRAVSLLSTIDDADYSLSDALATERTARQRFQEAAELLKEREAEAVMVAAIEATEKRGPLAGIAKTSKEYDFALTVLLNRERANGLGTLVRDVDRLKGDLTAAEVRKEAAVAHFSAVKHASDLLAALLRSTAE